MLLDFMSMFLHEFSKNRSLINVKNYKYLLDKLKQDANSIDLVEFSKPLTDSKHLIQGR